MKSSPTVFVVDDEEPIRDSFRTYLTILGILTRTFASADDFLAELDTCWTGFVFVDLRMAGTNGLELIEQLRERGSQLSAVLMTGNEADVPPQLAFDAGAIALLRKPFPIGRIKEILQGMMPR